MDAGTTAAVSAGSTGADFIGITAAGIIHVQAFVFSVLLFELSFVSVF